MLAKSLFATNLLDLQVVAETDVFLHHLFVFSFRESVETLVLLVLLVLLAPLAHLDLSDLSASREIEEKL